MDITRQHNFEHHNKAYFKVSKVKLDGSLPANPMNDRRIANAVTLKSIFCLP